jgi:hypothetical protein
VDDCFTSGCVAGGCVFPEVEPFSLGLFDEVGGAHVVGWLFSFDSDVETD